MLKVNKSQKKSKSISGILGWVLTFFELAPPPECNCAMHHKCHERSTDSDVSEKFYCINCSHLAAKRYKPFNLDTDSEENSCTDETIVRVNHIHDKCNSYSANEFNRTFCNQSNDNSSILFQNIDGNKSNFDSLHPPGERMVPAPQFRRSFRGTPL